MIKARGGRRVQAYALTMVTTVIVLLLALTEWWAERYFSDRSKAASISLEIAIVLVATLVFRPIHQRVEAALEAAFYKRKHQALAALTRLRREMGSFNDAAQLLRRVVGALEDQFEAGACAVYLRREVFRAEASSYDVAAGDVGMDDPLVIRLRSSAEPAKPELLNSSAHGTHAFPMTAAGDLIGFLTVHRKHADYDDDELRMLAGVAQDLGSALVALDPALRPLTAGAPNNIPADLQPLIGRDVELAEIGAALGSARLITITGPGGAGKTHLALQCAAAALSKHRHGVWFVNLAPITDAALIQATIASVIGANSAEGSDDCEHLLNHLRARDALIVIDNCEHVLAEAARIVARIRAACPQVTLLATSRESLHLDGEQTYRLGPLDSEAAVELFGRRAAAVSPGFDVAAHADIVRSICRHLDGIPLAIELAASRARALSVEETLQHLNERFKLLKDVSGSGDPRQQTLLATVQWSYGLLDAQEQSQLRRLSVFRGSFSLAAAAAVCAMDGRCDEYYVLDVLTSLADKSLLLAKIGITTRYNLLETIRTFAAQEAGEHGESRQAAEQHAAYFSELAAQAYHEFDSRLPSGWLARLVPDIDNFRAALEWTLRGQGDRRIGAQLAADCGPIFLRMELLGEGLHWCEAARDVEGIPAATAARVEYVASMMHNNLGQHQTALACAERSLRLLEDGADPRLLVRTLSQVAQLYARAKRFDDAREPSARAIEHARAIGDPYVLADVLRRCASALPPADIAQGRAYFAEAFDIAEKTKKSAEAARVLEWWAASEAAAGAIESAISLATDGLARSDDPVSEMRFESHIACWNLALERIEQARPHIKRMAKLAFALDYPLRALAVAYLAATESEENPDRAARMLAYAQNALRCEKWEPDDTDNLALGHVRKYVESRVRADELAAISAGGAALSDAEIAQIVSALV